MTLSTGMLQWLYGRVNGLQGAEKRSTPANIKGEWFGAVREVVPEVPSRQSSLFIKDAPKRIGNLESVLFFYANKRKRITSCGRPKIAPRYPGPRPTIVMDTNLTSVSLLDDSWVRNKRKFTRQLQSDPVMQETQAMPQFFSLSELLLNCFLVVWVFSYQLVFHFILPQLCPRKRITKDRRFLFAVKRASTQNSISPLCFCNCFPSSASIILETAHTMLSCHLSYS